ncbi:MAG: OmpA family protein [Bacteroidia bacterium]
MTSHKLYKKLSSYKYFIPLSENMFARKYRNKTSLLLLVSLSLSLSVGAQIPENNLGVISQIVMSSECLSKPNYNLFFESNVNEREPERSVYWYKLNFTKDCFIKLTLIPNNENDRYVLSLYSTKENEYFCEEREKIEDLEELVTFNDTQQPETFRKSVFYSKAIEVFDNEAIYIFINHQIGADSGHILEIQTCDDYSYILKVNKPSEPTDTFAEDVQGSGFDITKKLCEPNDSAHFGYVSFSNDKIEVSNYTRKKIDSINSSSYSATLLSLQEQTKEPARIIPDSLSNNSLKNDSLPNISFKSQDKNPIEPDNLNEQPKLTGIFKLIHKTPAPNGKDYKLADAYTSYLKTTETTPALDKKDSKPTKSVRTKRAPKKVSKLVPTNFIVVNAETGIILKRAVFKLIKESGLRPLQYTYNDSIGIFSAEIEAEGVYRIECDLIGYKNYAQQLNLKNKIVVDSNANYIVPLSPLKAGDKFVIPNIYFYPNAPAFKEESSEELNKLAKYMNDNNMSILIAGHTNGNKHISKDKRQTDEALIFSGSSKKLSKKRAEAVRDYLVKSGIDKKRINIKGYGGRKPIVPEPKNRKEGEKNMRVEIYITKF